MNPITASLLNRLYSLIILALTGLIVMLEPDTTQDDPAVVRCDAGNEAPPLPITEEPLLEDYPLPRAFVDWWTNEAKKRG
jgi:hypothetical protein